MPVFGGCTLWLKALCVPEESIDRVPRDAEEATTEEATTEEAEV